MSPADSRNRRARRLLVFSGIALPAIGAFANAASPTLDPAGHWVGAIEHGERAWPVELDIAPAPRQPPGTVSYPDGGRFAVPLTGLRINGLALELTHELDRQNVLWRGTVLDDEFSGVWNGLGVETSFRLTRKDRTARLLPVARVRFRNEKVVLGGTLIIPNGPGPYPAAVWIHGSGHVGRDQQSYRMWGYMLARHGVACLLYDKRGVGTSTGSFQTASLADLASDALAAVQVLLSHPDIDPERIGIGGFSQGGMIAPLALTRNDQLAFVIAMSASGVSPAEQSNYAIANQLRSHGIDPDSVTTAIALRRRLNEYIRTGTGRRALLADLREHSDQPWFNAARLPASSLDSYQKSMPDWAFMDPIPLWQRVTIPTLAVWGAEDQLVSPVRSFDLIEAALATAGNKDATLRILPGADHDLMRPDEPDVVWDGSRIAPELEPLMAEWIQTHVARPVQANVAKHETANPTGLVR